MFLILYSPEPTREHGFQLSTFKMWRRSVLSHWEGLGGVVKGICVGEEGGGGQKPVNEPFHWVCYRGVFIYKQFQRTVKVISTISVQKHVFKKLFITGTGRYFSDRTHTSSTVPSPSYRRSSVNTESL